jgi:hypothetical protein
MKKVYLFSILLVFVTQACNLVVSVAPATEPAPRPTNTMLPASYFPTLIPASATPLAATVAPTLIPATIAPVATATALLLPTLNGVEVSVGR